MGWARLGEEGALVGEVRTRRGQCEKQRVVRLRVYSETGWEGGGASDVTGHERPPEGPGVPCQQGSWPTVSAGGVPRRRAPPSCHPERRQHGWWRGGKEV